MFYAARTRLLYHLTRHACSRTSLVRWLTTIHARSEALAGNCRRSLSSRPSTGPLLCALQHRSVIRLSGADGADLLQGLITNDMKLLQHQTQNKSMYAMMLNIQGRVLYDLLVYYLPEADGQTCYLVECDRDVAPELIQTIKKYKLRRKVVLGDCSDEMKVYAVLPGQGGECFASESPDITANKDCLLCVPDPRIPQFGHRLIVRQTTADFGSLLEGVAEGSEYVYTDRRYQVGLSEGVDDLPPGKCTPLESNAVFLNGVSFSKGCYIGQELTARTHHTGVIRKRLMPVTCSSDASGLLPDSEIQNAVGKTCGKLRRSNTWRGLALLRVADALHKGPLVVKDSGVELETFIPTWWQVQDDEVIKQLLGDRELA